MAELVREKVLQLTSQEIPHSVAVIIEELEERPNEIVAVRAVIYTERESQKGILIGKGGRMLKKIGEMARQEIESLLGAKFTSAFGLRLNRAGAIKRSSCGV